MPDASITKPAGSPIGVPSGALEECTAFVIVTCSPAMSIAPPLPKPTVSDTPWRSSQPAISGYVATGAECSLATAATSPAWSPCPWVSRIASQRSIASPSGHEGLPENQGSMSTRAPAGVSI